MPFHACARVRGAHGRKIKALEINWGMRIDMRAIGCIAWRVCMRNCNLHVRAWQPAQEENSQCTHSGLPLQQSPRINTIKTPPFDSLFVHTWPHNTVCSRRVLVMRLCRGLGTPISDRPCTRPACAMPPQVRAVRLRRDRVVVALEHKVLVYNFADFKLLHQIETLANAKGLVAISSSAESTVLACPGLHSGQVRCCVVMGCIA